MAYIGNTVQNQGFSPAVDYYNGDGTTVTFTLSRPVASVAQLTAVIENVIQNPATAFTVSGNSITFTSAPPAGTNNIWVEYTSLVTTYAAISQDPSVIGDITATGGYLSTGDFGNTYVDGTIVDYVTGMARITTGPSDGITLYNGGTSSRTALMTISAAGNVGVGTSSPAQKLEVSGTTTTLIKNTTTTGANGLQAANTGGNFYFGIDDNGGGFYNTGTAYGRAIYSSGAYPVSIFTNATERMRIDSSGRVTTPYQPAFSANNSTNFTISSETSITYNTAQFNIGSNYSTGTGRFTAPIAGYYLFFHRLTTNSTNVFEPKIYINGTEVARAYSPNTSSNSKTVTVSTIWYLSANDYAQPYTYVPGSTTFFGSGPVQSSFYGYLLG